MVSFYSPWYRIQQMLLFNLHAHVCISSLPDINSMPFLGCIASIDPSSSVLSSKSQEEALQMVTQQKMWISWDV